MSRPTDTNGAAPPAHVARSAEEGEAVHLRQQRHSGAQPTQMVVDRSRWQTQGRGFYNLAVSPHRLDGEVQIVSEDGKRIYRQCTVGAVREKGGG